MTEPLIALTTYREPAQWGVWRTTADLLPGTYADSVARAGGTPVLIPPLLDEDSAKSVAERVDAIIISGGSDIDPSQYGQHPHRETSEWRPGRDSSELLLLEAASRASVPVLGICRGMQLMAVAQGGTICQHLPDALGVNVHSPGGSVFGRIRVNPVKGTMLHELLGHQVTVACHHHQSVLEHPGFAAAAYAGDGTLEAIEGTEHPWIGVQWHAENHAGSVLFRYLVRLASARRRSLCGPTRSGSDVVGRSPSATQL